MKTVIYDLDLEPITVIDIPRVSLDYLEKYKTLKLGVKSPQTGAVVGVVRLHHYRFNWWDNSIKYVVVTPDDVLCLRLVCDYLPGQKDKKAVE